MTGTFSAKKEASAKTARTASKLSPSARLFRSYGVAVTAIFLIGIINPASAYSRNSFYAPSMEGMDDYYGVGETTFMSNEDGYISKVNSQTELADRTTMNGRLIHTIESGDTLSTIAAEYGLKTNTVMWENGLSATSTLKIGQQLSIPPVDGVTHVVDKAEDVKKIATLYGVPSESILKQNQLDATAALATGQAIFVPGAKPLPVEVNRDGSIRDTSTTRIIAGKTVSIKSAVASKTNVGSSALVAGSAIGSNADSGPAAGKKMIFPTRGVITQYYSSAHYADDIANTSKPPIWAAADGKVIKASSGTWGGGYGNHIIIDHGNGLQTLYAHMEYLSVSVGDQVTQGQVIGKMGRTGNVRGRTGIHLHFEVRVNGVKKNPGAYF